MSGNSYAGKLMLLQIYDDATSSFKSIGGINTKSITRANPVQDATNQATTGNETESQFTGYGTVTIQGSGTVDSRSSSSIYAYKALATIANSSDPSGRFRITDSEETFDGEFTITNFEKNAEQTGLEQFTIGLQNCGTITYS